MAKTLSGISLIIRAFVPTGLTMQEQIATLTAIDLAVKTRKFSGVIDKAIIEDVKYTAGRKRFEDTGGVIDGDQTQGDIEEAINASQPTVEDLTPPAEDPGEPEEPTVDADMVPQDEDEDDQGGVPEWMQQAAAAEADLPKPVEAPRTDVPVAGKPSSNPINPAILAAAEAAKARSAAVGNTAPEATQPAVKPAPRQPAPADVAAAAAAAAPTVTSGPRRRTAPAK